VGDVAATREGESVCLGGTGMASRLESHGHSRGLRITCILMRQRRARKSRQSLGQFRRSRAGGGRPGRRGAGARRGPRARPRAAGRTAPHTVGTHARTTATQSIQIVDRRGVCVPTHSTKPAAVSYQLNPDNAYLPTLDQLNCGNEERKLNDASRVFPRRAAYRRLESRSICSAVARDEREIGSCNDVGSHRGSSRLSLVDSLDDMVDDKEADFEDDVSIFVLLVDVNSTSSLGCSQFTIRVCDSFDELVRGCGKNRARSRARC